MIISIKNPAPMDSRLKKWGDYHFGKSLSKALEHCGCQVETTFHDEWGRVNPSADMVIVLRGKHRFDTQGHRGIRVLWVISHPEDVSAEERAQYDLIYVASEHSAKLWQRDTEAPVKALLQCTDTQIFYPPQEAVRRNVIFVGNTRSAQRPLVLAAAALGLRPKVWGRGWSSYPQVPAVQASFIDNQQLGDLYRRSRLTLNDHWPDMREFGIVNNRIFDAIACGLPVLSDHNSGLSSLNLPGILTYADEQTLNDAVTRYWFCYPSLLNDAAQGAKIVAEEHNFQRRAETIISDISQF